VEVVTSGVTGGILVEDVVLDLDFFKGPLGPQKQTVLSLTVTVLFVVTIVKLLYQWAFCCSIILPLCRSF